MSTSVFVDLESSTQADEAQSSRVLVSLLETPMRPLGRLIWMGRTVISTDISKITRKQSKTGKHMHENQKRTKRIQRIKAEARKSKTAVKSSQHGQQQ
ncbi:hypothetical protein Tco_1112710, partial [Tanacetum coccineum]